MWVEENYLERTTLNTPSRDSNPDLPAVQSVALVTPETRGYQSGLHRHSEGLVKSNLNYYLFQRFTQYLASSNSTFQLSNFLDKSGVQGYDMSPFIRRYAKYLNEKALSYRTVAFDFCKVKRGKEEGTLRTMNPEKLLKTLPVLQSQLDALLEFDCTANDLTNGVINMTFMLLFRDLIRLFANYNDGVINLLEKYFDMNKKQCRDALDLYKKFLIRMDRVAEFLKVAEAPSSLLDALEQHLAALEGKKGSAANTPTQTASNRTNVKSGVSALSSTSTAFGTAAASTRLDSHSNGIDETLKQQVLAEEEAAMNQYKSKVSSPTSGGPSTNPFLSSPTSAATQQQAIVDLFGTPPALAADQSQAVKASDDLLQLSGNPFADIFSSASQAAPAPVSAAPMGTDMWLSNGEYYSNKPLNDGFKGHMSSKYWDLSLLPAVKASDDLLQLSGNPFADIFSSASQAAPAPVSAAPMGTDMWLSNGFKSGQATANSFVSDQNFSSVFGGTNASSAAPDGTSAPNPFMSDFPGAPAPSSLFDAPAGGTQPDSGKTDLFGADFSGMGTAQGGAPAATDLFGSLMQPTTDTLGGFGKGGGAEEGEVLGSEPQMFPGMFPGGDLSTSAPSPLVSSSASKVASPPPPRPPPPAAGGTPRTMSPAPSAGTASPVRQPPTSANLASKSAFDELNDSIRAALGGSPTRALPLAPQPPAAPQSLAMMSGFGSLDMSGGMLGGGGGVVFGQPSAFGSPGKQGMSMTVGSSGTMAPQDSAASKVLTGDLDSSLASLAQNLSINKGGQATVKGVQWNSPKNVAKPGATGWTPQPMAATTGAGYRPMSETRHGGALLFQGQGMSSMGATPQFPAAMPATQGVQGMAAPGMRPMGAAPAPVLGGAGMMGGGGMMGSPRIGGTNPLMGTQLPATSLPTQQQQPPLDPFGAL
ncbi:unnamed protein product [Timema podura]|uniref:AP180 N-terminal homology (ANTH) domain-containing protein n=1 Tax=Timema podura TaxID=61482 RepID=A0ABN7NPJ7_TIMPD|nr:unnamed protein product [Timema podura]